MGYVHFPSVKQPYFACKKPLHPISSYGCLNHCVRFDYVPSDKFLGVETDYIYIMWDIVGFSPNKSM